jgi:hypothetical protein
MTKTEQQPKGIPFLGIFLLSGAILMFMVAGMTCFVGAAHEHADESCTELCSALGHKKIKMTDLGCVCENTETQERKVHTGAMEIVR